MAIENETGLRVADHLGINRQIMDEDLQDQYYIQTGNLYERKIGELQPRGGSSLYTSTAIPSNITSFGRPFVHYDKFLGKTNIVNVKCAQQSSPITLSNIGVSWVIDAPNGKWGSAITLVKTSDSSNINNKAFIGTSSSGIRLVATGFGLNARHSSDFTASLPALGDTKKLEVTISSPGLGNSNITGIDVYASVTYSYTSGAPITQWMYVGHINTILNPTGTFTFYSGPITISTDPGVQVNPFGGYSSDTTYTLAGNLSGSGSLTAGKTYFVGVMSQHLYYDYANPTNSRTYWSCYSVQAVTLSQGQDSLGVVKSAGGSPATLIFFGTHPQMLQPFSSIVSNDSSFSLIFNSTNNSGTAAANQMGVAAFTPNSTTVNTGVWSYYQADFSTDEMFAKIDPSTSSWEAIPVANCNGLGLDTYNDAGSNSAAMNDFGVGFQNNNVGVASGAIWRGYQYNNQGQDLLYMLPSTGWNTAFTGNPVIGITATTTSGSDSITEVSSTTGLSVGMPVIGPMFNPGTGTSAISGTTITVDTVYGDVASTADQASASLTNTPLTFLPQAQAALPLVASLHNVHQFDGNVVCLTVPDFSNQPPPFASLITGYKERMVIAGGPSAAFNRCYFTDVQAPYSWGVPGARGISQYFQAESGGEGVTGISQYINTMYYTGPLSQFMVAKLNTCFVFSDIPVYSASNVTSNALVIPPSAVMIQLSRRAGCANHDTIVQTEMGTIYASIDNVWLCRDSGEPVPIGNEISYLLRPEDPSVAINTTYWSGSYHDNKYKLSYSVAGATAPSQELWLDLRKMKLQKGQPAWFGPMSGREVRFQTVEERYNDTIVPKRFCVDATNGYWYQADYESTRQDLGVDLTYTLQPHILSFKNPTGNKLQTRIQWRMKVDAQMTFSEAVTWLNSSLGTQTETNNRVVSPVTGYTGSTYANFVNNCRAKLYPFYTVGRLRGEDMQIVWSYTGHVLFTIAAWAVFTKDERRVLD